VELEEEEEEEEILRRLVVIRPKKIRHTCSTI
jgi:hypothetical protein